MHPALPYEIFGRVLWVVLGIGVIVGSFVGMWIGLRADRRPERAAVVQMSPRERSRTARHAA